MCLFGICIHLFLLSKGKLQDPEHVRGWFEFAIVGVSRSHSMNLTSASIEDDNHT